MGHVFAYRSSITKSDVLKIMAHSFTRRLTKVILVLLACLCNKVLNLKAKTPQTGASKKYQEISPERSTFDKVRGFKNIFHCFETVD